MSILQDVAIIYLGIKKVSNLYIQSEYENPFPEVIDFFDIIDSNDNNQTVNIGFNNEVLNFTFSAKCKNYNVVKGNRKNKRVYLDFKITKNISEILKNSRNNIIEKRNENINKYFTQLMIDNLEGYDYKSLIIFAEKLKVLTSKEKKDWFIENGYLNVPDEKSFNGLIDISEAKLSDGIIINHKEKIFE